MTHLLRFATELEYTDYCNSTQYVEPHVAVVGSDVKYQPETWGNVGDIIYYDSDTYALKKCSPQKWTSTLGDAIGVVVIPDGFTLDRKARMISFRAIDKSGNITNESVGMMWGAGNNPLTRYTKVPVMNNDNDNVIAQDNGYLPSDIFTGGESSLLDINATYYQNNSTNFIPSPYITNDGECTPNRMYYKLMEGTNTLRDFNGLQNTQILVNQSIFHEAANACFEYNDGSGLGIQWYLPAMGELGYLMSRLNVINESIHLLGGTPISTNGYWSSSEVDAYNAYCLVTATGEVSYYDKTQTCHVRPFAILP